jgi:hypothetical protein
MEREAEKRARRLPERSFGGYLKISGEAPDEQIAKGIDQNPNGRKAADAGMLPWCRRPFPGNATSLPNTMKTLHTILLSATLALAAAPTHAAIVAGLGEPTGSIRTDTYPGAGYGFFAPASGTTINQLGFWDQGGDGLLSSHTVVIYGYNGTSYDILASADVPAGTAAPLSGGYRWVSIPDLALPNNGQGADYYLIMATQNLDAWTDGLGAATPMDPSIGTTQSQAYIVDSSTLQAPAFVINGNSSATTAGFGGANLGFGSVPETSSLTLSFLAAGGFFIRRRR